MGDCKHRPIKNIFEVWVNTYDDIYAFFIISTYLYLYSHFIAVFLKQISIQYIIEIINTRVKCG